MRGDRYALKCTDLGKVLETITYKQWEVKLQRGCNLGRWVLLKLSEQEQSKSSKTVSPLIEY